MASDVVSPNTAEDYHPPRPNAEGRFYAITVGREPGIYPGTEDWRLQIEGISGYAVRSFDTQEAAKRAFQDALHAGLVYRVQIVGQRRILSENEISDIPGIHTPGIQETADVHKWYTVTVGIQPGLYLGSHNVSPLTSNIKGGKSVRWGSYEQAHESFMGELRAGRVIQDTTQIIRTNLTAPLDSNLVQM